MSDELQNYKPLKIITKLVVYFFKTCRGCPSGGHWAAGRGRRRAGNCRAGGKSGAINDELVEIETLPVSFTNDVYLFVYFPQAVSQELMPKNVRVKIVAKAHPGVGIVQLPCAATSGVKAYNLDAWTVGKQTSVPVLSLFRFGVGGREDSPESLMVCWTAEELRGTKRGGVEREAPHNKRARS